MLPVALGTAGVLGELDRMRRAIEHEPGVRFALLSGRDAGRFDAAVIAVVWPGGSGRLSHNLRRVLRPSADVAASANPTIHKEDRHAY